MARMPTVALPGAPLHVVQQAAAFQPMFREPRSFRVFLLDLGEAAAIHGCAVHAYVLTSDRVHLLVTPNEADGAARLLQVLGRRHFRNTGRRKARIEPPAEAYFRRLSSDSDWDVLACSRRIETRPVRAGLVYAPADYLWSSFRCNALGARDAIITPHPSYLSLGSTREARQRGYRALFERRVTADAIRMVVGSR